MLDTFDSPSTIFLQNSTPLIKHIIVVFEHFKMQIRPNLIHIHIANQQ